MWRNIKGAPAGSSPEIIATRNDFIDVFKSYTGANHDILRSNHDTLVSIRDATLATRDALLRLISVNEVIARRFENEANDARSAEIAERIARRFRDDRERNERNMSHDD